MDPGLRRNDSEEAALMMVSGPRETVHAVGRAETIF